MKNNHSGKKPGREKSISTKKKFTDTEREEGNNPPEKFPDYPYYPPTEDIFNRERKEINANEEEKSQPQQKPLHSSGYNEVSDEEDDSEKSEADVTKEDLKLLDDGLNSDGGEDDELRKREFPVDMSAEDLDIPGTELDDKDERIGEEDEENNSYSIGGDRHEDLEENRS